MFLHKRDLIRTFLGKFSFSDLIGLKPALDSEFQAKNLPMIEPLSTNIRWTYNHHL